MCKPHSGPWRIEGGWQVKLDYVTVEKHGGIAVVRFDRKANLNAFNRTLKN